MPPSSRHGRQPTFTKPVAAVFWLVVVGVVAVTAVAQQRLAIQLAVAGSLSVSLMIWSVYDTALREARLDYGRARTANAKAVGAAEEAARGFEREITGLKRQIVSLEAQLAEARSATELWDMSDAPTVVNMANRREARPIAIVKHDESDKRAAETA